MKYTHGLPLGPALIAVSTLASLSAHANDNATRPVSHGGNHPMGACAMVAVDSGNGRPQPLHAGPSAGSAVVGQVGTSVLARLCDSSDDSQWLGVVAPPAQFPDRPCLADTPPARRQAYAGTCLSGWVPADTVIAMEAD
jgi:hypothetical protein